MANYFRNWMPFMRKNKPGSQGGTTPAGTAQVHFQDLGNASACSAFMDSISDFLQGRTAVLPVIRYDISDMFTAILHFAEYLPSNSKGDIITYRSIPDVGGMFYEANTTTTNATIEEHTIYI